MNTIGNAILMEQDTEHLLNAVCMSGSEKFANICDLYSANEFIHDDVLLIACKVNYSIPSIICSLIASKLRSNEVIEGCVVMCGENYILVPKYLLARRFKSILELPTTGNGYIEIDSMDNNILNEFVHFIHYGQLSNDCRDIVEKLYELADRYKSESLENECELICLNSTKENDLLVCFKLGFIYGVDELKEYAVSQLKANFDRRTKFRYFESMEWANFTARNFRLALEIKTDAYKAVGILPKDYVL